MTTAEAGEQGDTQLQSIVRYVRYRAFESRTEPMLQRLLDVPVAIERSSSSVRITVSGNAPPVD